MGKQRVPLWGKPQGFVAVDPDATVGAQLGVNFTFNGVLVRPEDILNQPTPPPEQMLPNVYALALTTTTGLYVITGSGASVTRAIEGVAGRTLVTDGDGVAGPPVVDLDTLANTGVGTTPVKIYTRDAYGRIEGDEDASTTDLPEGSNLYFTDERAQDAVGSILEGGGANDVALSYADGTPSIFASIVPIFAGGTFGDGTHVARIAVNTKGQVTSAIEVPITGSGTVIGSVNSGTGIDVDNTDPENPVVNLDGPSIASLALADSATQPGDNVSTLANDSGYIPEAPIDGTPYARQDAGWVPATGGGGVDESTMGACFSLLGTSGASFSVRTNCNGTITSATVLAGFGQSGSAVFDILKSDYANYDGTLVSICAAAKPTLSGTNKSEDTTLTGWTTSFVAGDCFVFRNESNSGLDDATLILGVTKS